MRLRVKEEASNLYATIRSYALRGKLLSYKNLAELAEALSLDDLVNKLKLLPYKDALASLEAPYSARDIEKALITDLAKLHLLLAKASGSKLLFAYYRKYRALNIKGIVRAVLMNKGFEEIKELVNLDIEALVGTRDRILKLMQARSLDECVQASSGDEFFPEIRLLQQLNRAGQALDPQLLDVIIERAVMRDIAVNLFEDEGRKYLNLAGFELDSYNLMALLRGKSSNLPQGRLRELVVRPGYRLDAATINRIIAASDLEDAIRAVRGSVFASLIARLPQGQNPIEAIEAVLREELLKRARGTFAWGALGEECILAIILLKQEEVRLLSGLVWAVQERVPTKTIADTLLSHIKRVEEAR